MYKRPEAGEITRLLKAVADGNIRSRENLWKAVYDELRIIANAQVRKEARPAARQATTLIHEAYLRLSPSEGAPFENRKHFFAAAAQAMRCICVDDARKRGRLKRGAGREPSPLVGEPPIVDLDPLEVLAVDEALHRLDQLAPRQGQIVALRYFGGLTLEETAEALDISPRTVSNEWRLARAWLYRQLGDGENDTGVDL